jgi:RNA polymerase sigma-54 factor
MRLGLSQQLRTEQRLVQSPQMIQAMQILQCPMLELKDMVEQELQENPFLEEADKQDGTGREEVPTASSAPPETNEAQLTTSADRLEREFEQELDQLESRTDRASGTRPRAEGGEDGDRRLEALYNTPDPGTSLPEHVLEQARMQEASPELLRVIEHIAYSLDEDGRLVDTAEQIAQFLLVPIPLAEAAITLVRRMDPTGIGARDLRDCLLMQLERLGYVRPLTFELVRNHLEALALNKLPKIAKETGGSIEEIKESWEFIRTHLNPHPASAWSHVENTSVVPDVIVEEVDGSFEVRTERGGLPDLAISPIYRTLLKEARTDPKVYEYLRKKIESAKWFLEAVHQRQSTIQRIASEIVQRQSDFLRNGVQHLHPMKMQDVADAVHVHISTVSRAISGKYIQTPQGIFAMKRFFSGGTISDSGENVSQQAVKDTLRAIVEKEDKNNPLSDDQLVEQLASGGVHIARRTVTKYRKALGIESSSRRKQF